MTSTLLVHIDALDRSGPAWRALDGAMGRAGGALRSLRESLRDWTIIGQGAIRILGSLKDSFAGLVGQAQQQANAEVRLAAALSQSTSNVREQVQALREFADRRQQLTTFSDDVTLSLASLGASFGITGDTLMRTIEAVQDRAIAFGKDPEQLMIALGKFFQGTADDLGRLGIAVDETLPRTEAFQRVIQQLRTGVAEAVGELPTSAFEKLGNQVDEVRESLGFLITSTGTFQALTRGIGSLARSLSEALADPERLKAWTQAFDRAVASVVSSVGKMLAGIVGGIGTVFGLLETMLPGINSFFGHFDKEYPDKLKQAREEVDRLSKSLAELRDQGKLGSAAYADNAAHLDLWQRKLDQLEGRVDLSSDAFKSLAESIRSSSAAWAVEIQQGQTLSSVLDSLFAKLERLGQHRRQGTKEKEDQRPSALTEWAREFKALQASITGDRALLNWGLTDEQKNQVVATLQEQAREIGSAYTSAFSQAVIDSFDRNVGVREAFKRLGQDVRGIFIGQMSGAAFDPIKQSIGQLAQALAMPFNLVGRAINAALSPITNIIAAASMKLVELLASLIGIQIGSAAAGEAAMIGVTKTASGLAAAWGSAAFAASIATLGQAAIVGSTAASSSLIAGATLGRSLMAVGLAEGGLVMPRPGGVPAILAEAGEPELALPLSKAADFFRDAVGGSRVEIIVQIDRVSLLPEDRDRALADLGREMERQAQAVMRALPGSRFRRPL